MQVMFFADSSRAMVVCCVALVVWALGACASLCFGVVSIPLDGVFWGLLWKGLRGTHTGVGIEAIVWDVRMPRLLLATLVGAGLSVAGVTWQALLRNPLADPYLIGTSAGASLGAGIAFLFGFAGIFAWSVSAMAFCGALGATALVYRLGLGPASTHVTERLILAGVAVSAFLGAALSVLVAIRTDAAAPLYMWLMGSLLGRGWAELYQLLPPLVLSLAVVFWFAPRLNLLQLGDELAFGLGCNVVSTRRTLVMAASLLTAAVVAVSGMIGFVGLVVPHWSRLLLGPDLRVVLPLAACLGASLLVVADLCARTLLMPTEIPVGVVTALMGAPFFLSFLVRSAR